MRWFLVDRRPPRDMQRYYHTLMRIWTQETPVSTNQTPPTNVDGRWYGPVMKISAMTHGTVDHGGSNCGPEKNLEGFKQVQTRSTSLDLEGRQRTDGTGLCCLGGRLGQTRYLE